MWSSKKTLIFVFIAVAAAVSFAVFFMDNSKPSGQIGIVTGKIEIPKNAWLEIIKPSVSEIGNNKELIKEMKSGDAVSSGMTLSVSSSGQAVIHFPDGSVLRADSGSVLKIEESSFEPKSETLSVKVTLMGGRVWSKVIALVSPSSVWQVKTSSAVATVRGTSFSTEYINGKTKFLGSQNKVKVAVVDPKTGELKKETEADLTPKTIIEIKDTDIPKIIATPATLAVSVAPKAVIEESWAKENESADVVVDKTFSEIRNEEKNDQGAREKLREFNGIRREEVKKEAEAEAKEPEKPKPEKTFEKSAKRLLEIKSELKIEENNGTKPEETDKDIPADTVLPESVKPVTGTSVTAPSSGALKTIAKPVKVYIKGLSSGTDIMEGSSVPLRAMVVFSDGTERDMNSSAKWIIRGKIGKISTTGAFAPAFDEADSELESVSGDVTVSVSIDGVALSSQPVPVRVVHIVEETDTTAG